MIIVAIDPGTTESGYVAWDAIIAELIEFDKIDNQYLLEVIDRLNGMHKNLIYAIEEFKSFGMPMGQTTINSILWSGRFYERIKNNHSGDIYMVPRKTYVTELCSVARAKDGNVSRRLKNLFGEKGTKKNPGKLYGMKSDCWRALGMAVYVATLNGYSYEDKYSLGL